MKTVDVIKHWKEDNILLEKTLKGLEDKHCDNVSGWALGDKLLAGKISREISKNNERISAKLNSEYGKYTTESLLKEQAQALKDACISCIEFKGDTLTLESFKQWIKGTVDNYEDDLDWIKDVKDFGIDMDFVKANANKVYGYIFVNN